MMVIAPRRIVRQRPAVTDAQMDVVMVARNRIQRCFHDVFGLVAHRQE